MHYNFKYPKIHKRMSNLIGNFTAQTGKRLEPVRRRIKPFIEPAKIEIKETKDYYVGNAKEGWIRGRRLAKFQHRNHITSFFFKSTSAIAKTKIRSKDIVPLASAFLFSVTNPIVGMGIVGFALGQKFNTNIVNGFKSAQKALSKIRIK